MDNTTRKTRGEKATDTAVKAAKVAKKGAVKAAETVGEIAHKNRAKIDRNLDQLGAKVNARTDGKHAPKVEKAKKVVRTIVDKVADQRPAAKAARGKQTSATMPTE